MVSEPVVKALAVAAELCGASISHGAARVIVGELNQYQEGDVLRGLDAMRRKHEGGFSLAVVLRFVETARDRRLSSATTCCSCHLPAVRRVSGASYCEAHAVHAERPRVAGAQSIGALLATITRR